MIVTIIDQNLDPSLVFNELSQKMAEDSKLDIIVKKPDIDISFNTPKTWEDICQIVKDSDLIVFDYNTLNHPDSYSENFNFFVFVKILMNISNYNENGPTMIIRYLDDDKIYYGEVLKYEISGGATVTIAIHKDIRLMK